MRGATSISQTVLPVVPLALGCEALGGKDWGTVDLPAARDAVRCAIENGITLFDTADVYGLGRSEEELARALGNDRHRVTIVTKGGIRWGAQLAAGRARTVTDTSAAHLQSALHGSLRRLRLDAIPLYLVHRHTVDVPEAETLDFLERARVDGKILSYGVSNWPLRAIRDAREMSAISAVEGPLSLLSPESALRELAMARALRLTTLTYGPLAQGLLTGKYGGATSFETSDRRHRLDHFSSEAFERYRPVLDALGAVAREAGRSPSQVAIRWVLSTGVVSSVIFGAKSPEQVIENQVAVAFVLDASQNDRLRLARDQAGLSGT